MCCTRSKLSLYLKCIREAFKHLVIRNTKLIQFFNLTFFYSRICQVLSLHFFNFIRKLTNWFKRMSTYKICGYSTKESQ